MIAPKFIQLAANTERDGDIYPAHSRDTADFFSVYVGEPGDYAWDSDHAAPEAAEDRVRSLLAQFGGAPAVARAQFDAVMGV